MPRRPRRPCPGGCGALTERGPCDPCKAKRRKQEDRGRGAARERGYDSRWEKARAGYLRAHPLCECEDCTREARVLAATVVDHVTPHRGDRTLFWDRANWRAMSKACHDRKTAREDGGFGR